MCSPSSKLSFRGLVVQYAWDVICNREPHAHLPINGALSECCAMEKVRPSGSIGSIGLLPMVCWDHANVNVVEVRQ